MEGKWAEKLQKINPEAFELLKKHKKKIGYAVGIGAALELACFIGSFYVFRKMNNDQDFRFKIHKNCPPILDLYYTAAEKTVSSTVRQDDAAAWKVKAAET